MMMTIAPARWPDLQSQADAFDDARMALGLLGVPDVLPALRAAQVTVSHAVLGGSHSVAVYPPIDSLIPVDPRTVLGAIGFGADTSLYVHIPFCETRCTFCHYTVQHYPGKGRAAPSGDDAVIRYLAALKQELALWGASLARSNTAISSIYIGGGTPLVLEQYTLRDLLRAIAANFNVLPGAEICIEGSPLTITAPDGADKLRFLKEHGVTRLSFGVQSFDDEVLRFAGRGYRRDVAIRAARVAGEVFDNWNLDLIQGLYKGSPAESWQNLQVIAELQPAHLTWYHGRFADRPQGDWYQSPARHHAFEDEFATLQGRMLIWRGMESLGYQQCDGNRFVRARQYADPFKKIRTSLSRDLLGVGVASYSHVSRTEAGHGCLGYLFRNNTDVRSYSERLAGTMPIATGRAIDDAEYLSMSYVAGLRRGRVEDAVTREISVKCAELALGYRQLASWLNSLKVLERYGDCQEGLRLSQLGRLFEDETLALFFSPAVKLALAAKADPATPLTYVATRRAADAPVI